MTTRCCALTLLFALGAILPRSAAEEVVASSNLESFDYVWSTVRDRHWDPDLGGLDWDQIRAELRPKIARAESVAEARTIMSEMLARLGQSHYQIIPGLAYGESTDSKTASTAPEPRQLSGAGVPGFEVRVHDGEALVVSVEPELPASRAGVRAGWLVTAVNGESVQSLIKTAAEPFAESSLLEAMSSFAVQDRLSADIGGKIKVDFKDGKNETRTLEISCVAPPGRLYQVGNLPPVLTRIKTETIEYEIGYIGFNLFMDPPRLMRRFADFMKQHLDAPGIVMDLRGNPGGFAGMAMGIGGWFVDSKGQKLGTMVMRDTKLKLIINPRGKTFSGKLAILVDGNSMSTSEILAGGFQELGLARVFGTATAGAALPSMFERLPNGDGFQYVFANFLANSGKQLEGRGVTPDVEVVPDRDSLLAGEDPALAAAVRWIRSAASEDEGREGKP